MSKILVTGANGFLGSEICATLIAEGHDVIAMIRAGANDQRLRRVAPAARIAKIESDWRNIESVVSENEPEFIIHTAAAMDAGDDVEAATNLMTINVVNPARLLGAAKYAGVRGFITVGTAWQHNQGDGYEPVNLYAASKQAFDDVLRYYAGTGLPCASLHMFDSYGYEDPREKLINLLLRLARTGDALAMSPGEQEIDLVHVTDAAAAFARMITLMQSAQYSGFHTFAVAGGNPMPVRRLAELVEQVTGKELNINWGGRDYRMREVMRCWRGGAAVPGWSPKISLRDGIRKIWQDQQG